MSRGEPRAGEVEDALEVFGAIIGGTAQQAADQLRDRAALSGALGRPISHAQYESADLALQAAVLAQGIAETQPFIDGNKRLALVAMLAFLELNGVRIEATDREFADWIVGFSAGATPQQIAIEIRRHAVTDPLTIGMSPTAQSDPISRHSADPKRPQTADSAPGLGACHGRTGAIRGVTR